MRALPLLLLLAPSLAFAATGTIDIRVDDAPGEVVLDGFPTGQTAPTKMQSVPQGEHEIELEYGCRRGEATVTVEPAQTAVVELEMVDRGGEGTLFLRGLADNADVTVNGAPVSGADEGVKVPCGPAKVAVAVPGFEAWGQDLVITTGKRAELDVELEYEAFDLEPAMREPLAEEEDGDFDFLDEDEGPREPSRPLTELEMLDAEEEDSGRRGRDRGDEDDSGREELFGELGDPEFDEPRRGEPELDEPEYDDLDDPYLDDRPDDEDELERLGASSQPRSKSEKAERKPLPVRGLVTGAGATVAVVGLGIGVGSTPGYVTAKSQYDALVASRGLGNAETQNFNESVLTPAQSKVAVGYLVGAVGLGVGAAGYFLVPPRDAGDLVVTPTGRGLLLSGSF